MTEGLRARLQSGLTEAMKSRDQVAVRALRSALGAIANAEAIDVQHAPTSTSGPIAGAVSGVGASEARRRELSNDDVVTIVETEIAERRSAADEYERLGQAGEADRLRAEAGALGAYLSVDDATAEPT